MTAEYHRLGDYIREVNVRNRELKVTRLLGVGLEKKFFPSIANIIGTDLSNYKLIQKGQFGCKFMSVGRDGILPVSLLEEDEPAIISSAYYVFEVNDPNELLPDYLMMWLRRPEFDRQLWFYSGGDVRGGVNYDAFCEMPIYVPSIDRQREIVSEYETLTRRIRLNNQMIEKLEATAQALYHKTFVASIDKQNLPKGWRMGTLSDLANITMGQSPDGETYNMEGEGMIFYQGRADFGNRFPTPRVYTTDPTRYAKEGDVLLSVRAPVGDINITPHGCCIGRGLAALRSKNNCQSFLFYQMLELEHVFNISDDDGTVFGSINKDDLYNIEIVIPTTQEMSLFEKQASIIDKEIKLKDKEINILNELQSLLLSRMGK